MKILTFIFYNHWHNGDIHFSREFIKDIAQQLVPHNVYYAHSNHPRLIPEIPFIDLKSILKTVNQNQSIIKHNDTYFINTWVGQDNKTFVPKDQASLDEQYVLWQYLINQLPVSIALKAKEYYFPRISKILAADQNKVLICNNFTHSNQTQNLDRTADIRALAREFPEFDFYTTQATPQEDNVTLVDTILQDTSEAKLNLIGKFATTCGTIFTTSSGPGAFVIHEGTVTNPDITFVSLTKSWLLPETIYFDLTRLKAHYIHNTNEHDFLRIMREVLHDKRGRAGQFI